MSAENENTVSENGNKRITLAPCGMDCTVCRFAEESGCPGCMQGRLFEDEDCEMYNCCTVKGLAHCGQCDDFPCGALKAASFDPETGDGGNRLMRLKEIRDSDYRSFRRNIACIGGGICIGIAAGAAAGGFMLDLGTWIFAGAVIGGGIGAAAGILGGKK